MSEEQRVEFPNWFASTEAKQNFEKFLEPYKGHTELQFLQLGAYTGDASVWLLKNILTDKSSHLTDVDTWEGSDEVAHDSMDFKQVEEAYDYQTRGFKNVTKFKGTTIEWLKAAPFDYYDFIYVDADHTSPGVLIDAELSFLSLKSGGIIAFDDYQWDQGRGPVLNPKSGIDTFIWRHQKELEIIHIGWQVWVTKK